MRNFKIEFKFLLLLACAAQLASCANGGSSSESFRAAQNTQNSFNPLGFDRNHEDGPFICRSKENVKPIYDRELNGNGYYTACYARSSLYAIRVETTFQQPAESICAFPVQYVDSRTSFLKPDLETGRPLSLCSRITEGRAFFTFEQISYNTLIIVPEEDREAMTVCLETSQSWLCPSYSYGRFRDN